MKPLISGKFRLCFLFEIYAFGVVVQNTLSDSGGKCVAMVTAYYAKT